MAIISIQRDQNNTISIVRMQVSDTLATVSMTDYILNNQNAINALNGGTWAWFITDMILVAAEDGNAFYEFIDTTFATIVIFGQKGTGTVNPGLQNNIPYYAANGNTLSPLSNLANAILATNGSNVPGLTQTLPTAVQANISTLGTVGTGVWNATPVTVPFGGSGLSSLTAYAVLCGGTTSTGNFQQVSGLGTTGYVLTSNGAGALPTWQVSAGSGTVSSGTANDLAFYQTTGTTVSPLASAASGTLITSGLGVPSISQTLPSAVQGNITALGTIATGVWQGTTVAIGYGGTGVTSVTTTPTASAWAGWDSSKNLSANIFIAGSSGSLGYFTSFPPTASNGTFSFRAANNANGYNCTLSNTTTTQSTVYTLPDPGALTATVAVNTGSLTNGHLVSYNGTSGLLQDSGIVIPSTGSPLPLNVGGTNASLTAAAGGVTYSTASALAISAAGSSGQLFQSAGTSAPGWTTATYPAVATTAGTILRADGTNWVKSTATFADTYSASTILYSNGANTVTGLATANSSVLVTNGSGVPSWSTTLPSGLSATNLTLTTPILGTPQSGTLTNCTGLPVAGGGTGDASFTAYAVICGGTTSTGALQSIAGLGSSGQVLTSNGAGALPTFQTVSGSGTVNSGTAGQLAYYATSSAAVSGGQLGNVKGTATNDNASAGNVGEFVSNIITSGSPVNLTTGNGVNITSISLTAGDWDVWGNVQATTSIGASATMAVWISSTSATAPDAAYYANLAASALSGAIGGSAPQQRFSLSGTTTIYLTANSSSGSGAACGAIYARRIR